MVWIYFCVGAVLAAAISVTVTLWWDRRAVTKAKLLSERSHVRSHLLELANLTAGLAHEIKNPLSTVKINLKLLAEDLSMFQDDIHRRSANRLERLQDEVQRLNDILDDFLRYAGQQEVHLQSVDIRQILQELVDFFSPQADSAHIVLRCALGPAPVVCDIDARLVKQAILNLMINATQVMTEGGELWLRLSAQPRLAIIEVIDSGPGMPPEVRQRIFDAYYSTRPGGTGLGLPMSRRIIRQHDGELTVDSEPGKGTRFVITLPLAEQPGQSKDARATVSSG